MTPPLTPLRNVVATFEEPGWNYGYAASPWFEFDRARGATYTVYNRRLMPLAYADADPSEDYWAFRRAVAHTPTGELPTEIAGPQAEALCAKLFTKNMTRLKPGRCAYGIACYPDGGLIVDGILLRLAQDRFWYVQADGDLYSWLIAQSEGMEVAISDPNVWINQVQGPKSLDVLAAACDEDAPEPFKYFGIATVSIAGQRITVTRTGWTGELGWEYYANPGETDCTALWNAITEAGRAFGMVHTGLDAMDIRRIEAAILNAGSDFDREMTPFQAGLGGFADMDGHDFIGRSALESADRRVLLHGLRCADAQPLMGGEVAAGGRAIGRITAGARSPYLECGTGYVRLDDPEHGPGAAVEIAGTDGRMHPGAIVALPYYDTEKRIPRGLHVEFS